jgi:hypothetical protein
VTGKRVELAVAYADDEATSNTGKKYRAGMFVPALFTERSYTPKMVLWKPTLPDCEKRENPNRMIPGFETVTARPTFYRRAQSLDQRLRLPASGRVAAPAGVIVQIASAASIFSTSDSVTAKFS